MKHPRMLLLGLAALLAGAAGVTLVRAQRTAAPRATPGPLATALTCYEAGQFELARQQFAAVATNDAAYPLALAYDALCRYELCRAKGKNQYQWFLNALNGRAWGDDALLPPALREELAFKEVDARYRRWRFGDDAVAEAAGRFLALFPASAQRGAAAEYAVAGRWERGLDLLSETSYHAAEHWQDCWTNGLANLEQFLQAAAKLPAGGYGHLTERSLERDLAAAVLLIAGEPGRLGEVAAGDAVTRERLGLVRVVLQQRLHPEQVEENLDALAAFVAELERTPASSQRRLVEKRLANFGFVTGEWLYKRAGGDAAQRAAGSEYFEMARALQERLVATWPSGADEDGLRALWHARFDSYCWENKNAALLAEAAGLRTNSPGSRLWLLGRWYEGIGLTRTDPPQSAAAAAAFEEVMGWGFAPAAAKDQRGRDALVLGATRWRIGLAMQARDHAKVRALMQWVEQSSCEAKLKEEFQQAYAALAAYLAGR